MTLEEYKLKYGLRFSDIADRVGKPISTVQFWLSEGYKVSTRGKELHAVIRPSKTLWASKEQLQRMEQLGVEQ